VDQFNGGGSRDTFTDYMVIIMIGTGNPLAPEGKECCHAEIEGKAGNMFFFEEKNQKPFPPSLLRVMASPLRIDKSLFASFS